MYVCVCNQVNETSIRQIIHDNHITSLQELEEQANIGTGCRLCIERAEEILQEELVPPLRFEPRSNRF